MLSTLLESSIPSRNPDFRLKIFLGVQGEPTTILLCIPPYRLLRAHYISLFVKGFLSFEPYRSLISRARASACVRLSTPSLL